MEQTTVLDAHGEVSAVVLVGRGVTVQFAYEADALENARLSLVVSKSFDGPWAAARNTNGQPIELVVEGTPSSAVASGAWVNETGADVLLRWQLVEFEGTLDGEAEVTVELPSVSPDATLRPPGNVVLAGIPTYEDNAAALSADAELGSLYTDGEGGLFIVWDGEE